MRLKLAKPIICLDSSSMYSILGYFTGYLKKLAVYLNDCKLKELIDYTNQTIFIHFSLYKYVFTNDKDNYIQNDERLFVSPDKDMIEKYRLKDAKPCGQAEYDRKLLELDNREKKIKELFSIERDKHLEQEKMAQNLINYVHNDAFGVHEPLNEEVFFSFISLVYFFFISIFFAFKGY